MLQREYKSTNQVRLDEMKIMAFDIPWPTQWLCKHRDCLAQHEQRTLDCFRCTHGHSKQAVMQKNYIALGLHCSNSGQSYY